MGEVVAAGAFDEVVESLASPHPGKPPAEVEAPVDVLVVSLELLFPAFVVGIVVDASVVVVGAPI